LTKYLESRGIKATVVELSGAVEISIQLGIADSAADVVETGTTIRQAGLQVVLQLMFFSWLSVLTRGCRLLESR
jgi:ATP phosphoribosyltransferase